MNIRRAPPAVIGVGLGAAGVVTVLAAAILIGTRSAPTTASPAVEERRAEFDRQLAEAEQRHAAELAAAKPRAEKALGDARDVWRAFDALPKARRDKATLGQALLEAQDAKKDLPSEYASQIEAHNFREYRARAAPMFRPSTRATGAANEIVVPSPTYAECIVWGAMWSNEPDTAAALRSMGFHSVHCDSQTRTSAITGKSITDDARDWPL